MSRHSLYIAVTGHGFGHAVRAASVAAKIKELNPEILLILTTTAPRWLLESYIQSDFIHRPLSFDVGVIQADSLNMDKLATKAKMEKIISQQNSLIAREINYLKTNRVDLILADIPPLVAKIAQFAEIPCWMMSNFGWDFIYHAWGDDFREIAEWCSECYQKCDRLFRLPLHESMLSFRNITDVGLTGGNPRYTESELRSKFNLTSTQEKTVLLTFGGLGLETIPYENLSNFSEQQFITFDQQAPNLPNLVKITETKYRPVDFMPLCGRVVSKPGYSTFAETIRLDVPIVSITRDDFAEAELLLEGIKNYSVHQIIEARDFFSGNWSFLHETPNQPLQKVSLATNGTEKIAQEIVNYFNYK
jgi:predicted glycosyltransferase